MNKLNKISDGSYIFQVEITLSASSNGAALEQLIRVLNNGEFVDYRIGSGKTPHQHNPLESRINQYIESNELIRLNVNKGRGIKMSIPCRVINFDVDSQLLTVYHVDEKQVYSMGLNEIDDFVTE
jgi:hypothetical protein